MNDGGVCFADEKIMNARPKKLRRGGYQPPANNKTASKRAADSRPYAKNGKLHVGRADPGAPHFYPSAQQTPQSFTLSP